MRFGESYKTGIYLIVSIVGHRETGFPVRRSKDLLEIPDCLRRAVKIVRSERPSNSLTVDDTLFSLKGLVSAVWPSMEMPSQLLTARLRNTPSVLFHVIKELWWMAVTFISMDWIKSVPGDSSANYFITGKKPLMPNIDAFLRCQKNENDLPHITCSSVRGHMMWYL